jgi:hypothetical protein
MDEKCACAFIHVENINNILMCAENIEKWIIICQNEFLN